MPVYFPSSGASSGYANIANWNPASNLTHWRAAKARVQSGSGNARILFIGDSTTLGVGSTNSVTTGNQVPGSFPTQIATDFNNAGLNAHWNSFCGGGAGSNSAPDRANNDSRFSLGSDWSYLGTPTLGGAYLTASSGGSHPLAFTPTVNVDTFDVFYWVGSGGGMFSLNINGSSATNVNASGGANFVIAKTTVTGTLGSNTLNINWVSGGSVYIVAVSARDSSKSCVDCMNAGWSGATAASFAANGVITATNGTTSIPVLAPDLTIIDLGINDWVGSESYATFAADMQSFITACKATGDVALMTPNPSGTVTGGSPSETGVAVAAQLPYVQILRGLANTNNIPLFDLWGYWGGWDAVNNLAVPLPYNNYHPNANGYINIAAFLSAPLLAA